jgi:acetyltransferase-like isoleucine patch superfamily enzyme
MSAAGMLAHDWFPRPLPPNVLIGERSWIYSSYAFLHCASTRPAAVRVGSHSGVYHGCFFELGPEGEVEIGNYCTLVGAIIRTNGRVIVHDYAFIAHEVVIADTPAPVPPGSAWKGAPEETRGGAAAVVVGENAWIGARAVLLAGARIGRNAIVGAAAVIDFEVPDDAVAVGNPGRIVRHGGKTGERSP